MSHVVMLSWKQDILYARYGYSEEKRAAAITPLIFGIPEVCCRFFMPNICVFVPRNSSLSDTDTSHRQMQTQMQTYKEKC